MVERSIEYKRWYGRFLGRGQSHAYWMYKIIEDVLNENKQIKGIIELGYGRGALSLFLGLECYERGLKPLLTYDILPFNESRLTILLDIRFINRDYYHEDSLKEITEYINNEPILFMSDGGDRVKAFNYFVGMLNKGSVFASHDWESIPGKSPQRLNDITSKDTVTKYSLEPLYREEWNYSPDYIKTCFWRKTI